MIRFLLSPLLVGVLTLGLALGAGDARAQTPAAPPAPQIVEMSLGNPEASLQIIEYASFTCPHCAAFHAETLPRLKADYIDTGKVHFLSREVFFDRYGLWAALVARCGGPERYFGLSGLLYENQRAWATLRDPVQAGAELRRLGRIGGLDEAQLDACLSDIETARALVQKSDAERAEHQIDSTPSLVIGGKTYRNMPYADLRAIIDAALAR